MSKVIKNLSLGTMVFLVGGLGATMWMQNKRFASENNSTLNSRGMMGATEEKLKQIAPSLSSTEYTNYPIGQIIPLNEESKLVRLVLSKQGEPLRLNLNRTISKVLIVDPRKKENITPVEFYPINACDTVGFLDVLVSKKEQPEMFKSKTGMSFGVQGPFESEFQYDKNENNCKSISLVAQDVEHGIAPSFQLMSEILVNSQNDKNRPKIHLYYIVSKSDYLLRESLEDLKIPFQGKLEVTTIMNKNTDKKPWEALSENLQSMEKIKQNSTSGPIIVCGTKDFESNIKTQLSKHHINSITLQKDL